MSNHCNLTSPSWAPSVIRATRSGSKMNGGAEVLDGEGSTPRCRGFRQTTTRQMPSKMRMTPRAVTSDRRSETVSSKPSAWDVLCPLWGVQYISVIQNRLYNSETSGS